MDHVFRYIFQRLVHLGKTDVFRKQGIISITLCKILYQSLSGEKKKKHLEKPQFVCELIERLGFCLNLWRGRIQKGLIFIFKSICIHRYTLNSEAQWGGHSKIPNNKENTFYTHILPHIHTHTHTHIYHKIYKFIVYMEQ